MPFSQPYKVEVSWFVPSNTPSWDLCQWWQAPIREFSCLDRCNEESIFLGYLENIWQNCPERVKNSMLCERRDVLFMLFPLCHMCYTVVWFPGYHLLKIVNSTVERLTRFWQCVRARRKCWLPATESRNPRPQSNWLKTQSTEACHSSIALHLRLQSRLWRLSNLHPLNCVDTLDSLCHFKQTILVAKHLSIFKSSQFLEETMLLEISDFPESECRRSVVEGIRLDSPGSPQIVLHCASHAVVRICQSTKVAFQFVD